MFMYIHTKAPLSVLRHSCPLVGVLARLGLLVLLVSMAMLKLQIDKDLPTTGSRNHRNTGHLFIRNEPT